MLLEDERGTVNLIVPSGVYERRREVVRSAPLVRARGKLERREGVINVLVADLEELRWSAKAEAERVEPGRVDTDEDARDDLAARRRARQLVVAELRAVVQAGHSFGRRGR